MLTRLSSSSLRAPIMAATLVCALPWPSQSCAQDEYNDIFESVFNGVHRASIEQVGETEDVTEAETGLSGYDDDDDNAIEFRSRALQVPTTDGGGPLHACWERVYLVAKKGDRPKIKTEGLTIQQSLDARGGKLIFATAMASNQLMVQYKPNVLKGDAVPEEFGGGMTQTRLGGNLYLLKFEPKRPKELYQLLRNIRAQAGLVEMADLDHLGLPMSNSVTAVGDPNDFYYGEQWNLRRIRAKEAWAKPVTEPPAVVAIFDTGLKVGHPDLVNNLFVNPKDLSNGRNFILNNAVLTDPVGHGTHVAGIIGAETDNNTVGVASVARTPKLMGMLITKTTDDATTAMYSAAAAGMLYIRDLFGGTPTVQVHVANHSWGGTSYNAPLFTALNNSQPSGEVLPGDGAIVAKWAKGSRVLEIVSGSLNDIKAIQKAATVNRMPELSADLKSAPVVLFTTFDTATNKTFITISGVAAKASASTGSPLNFLNAITYTDYGIVHVAAAGSAKTGVAGADLDANPRFPACFPSDLVVAVGASKHIDYGLADAPMKESNFGKQTVHLFAPGEDIWSTNITLNPQYKKETAGSYSAAHVSGALAYYLMTHGGCTPVGARTALLQGGFTTPMDVPAFKDKCVTNSRLDMKNLIDAVCPAKK